MIKFAATVSFIERHRAKDQPVRPRAELNDNPQACVHTRETVGWGNDVDVKKSNGNPINDQTSNAASKQKRTNNPS